MPLHTTKPYTYTIYRLGLWYTLYRLVIVIGLIIIFQLISDQFNTPTYHPAYYFYGLITYCAIASIQFLYFKFYLYHIPKQLILVFVTDVIALSLLTFTIGTPTLNLDLLYVITVFSATILLNRQIALMITLFAVITLIYQYFFKSLFNYPNISSIGNSLLLAFLFFVIYGIGRVAIQYFKVLDNISFHQAQALYLWQNINRYILEQIDDGYLVLDEKYYIILSNPAACTLLGIPTLFANEPLHLSLVQHDLLKQLQTTSLEDGEQFIFKSPLSSYQVSVKVQRLIVPQQALILLRLQNVQQLNQQVQQLKLAALGQLSASIAHEIRNPLAAIVQANHLYFDSDAAQQQHLQRMIAKQSERINEIIEGTLRMARNDLPHANPIKLHHFLSQFIAQDLADVQQCIRWQSSPDLVIWFDPKHLAQVLINLIRNALRHNDPEVGYIQLEVYTQTPFVIIDVIDFGTGVTKQHISQLFKPFFSTEITGTGLGLYLSHGLCEANQAELSYVKQAKGACFRIRCSTKNK